MKVASISLNDNHTLSIDVSEVGHIVAGTPMALENGVWFRELLVRTVNGTVALQLVADSPDKLAIETET